jgi:hypothetical protein
MINKKILAVAVASVFAFNANAAVTLTDTTADLVSFATETFTSSDLNADSLLPVTNVGNVLDVKTTLGFTISAGTSKYVRIDLTAAQFDGAPALTAANTTGTISAGGDGEMYVIFEVTSTDGINDLANSLVVTVASDYAISTTATNTVTYALYESASNAVNQVTGTALSTRSEAFTSTASASTGTFTVADTATATVASKFLKFVDPADSSLTVTEIAIGAIDTSELLKSGTFLNASSSLAVVVGDLYTTPQDVTFSGNFSAGTWTTDTSATCANAGTAVTLNTAKTVATAAALAVGVPVYLCVDNGTTKKTISKGSYSVTLVDDKITNTIGKIVYNTTSVEVPYVTTFSGYNQRFYLVNNGSVDSTYTFAFTSEAGVTATPGTAATGTIPAGKVLSLNAADVVTLSGKSRTSATIEVEAEDADFSAATQSVNLSDGSTDTVVLN